MTEEKDLLFRLKQGFSVEWKTFLESDKYKNLRGFLSRDYLYDHFWDYLTEKGLLD